MCIDYVFGNQRYIYGINLLHKCYNNKSFGVTTVTVIVIIGLYFIYVIDI